MERSEKDIEKKTRSITRRTHRPQDVQECFFLVSCSLRNDGEMKRYHKIIMKCKYRTRDVDVASTEQVQEQPAWLRLGGSIDIVMVR